ncbi:IS1 family transposase [Methylocaldum szegediense]|uniref:IS1 family transposase n=1 Tax=Methylocaldum szegediense TaxID=73780 RepID=UPI0037C79735
MLECDEAGSYVGLKATLVWLSIASASHARRIVAYALGDRTEATARQLWDRVSGCYDEAEAWDPYSAVTRESTSALPEIGGSNGSRRTLGQDLMPPPAAIPERSRTIQNSSARRLRSGSTER